MPVYSSSPTHRLSSQSPATLNLSAKSPNTQAQHYCTARHVYANTPTRFRYGKYVWRHFRPRIKPTPSSKCTTLKSLLQMSKHFLSLVLFLFGLGDARGPDIRKDAFFHSFISFMTLFIRYPEKACCFVRVDRNADITVLRSWTKVNKVAACCGPGARTTRSCQSWAAPVIPVTPWALLSCYCWRKECPHDLRQVIPWPKRLPPWHNRRPRCPSMCGCVCVHAPSQSVPRVAVKNCHNVSRLALLRVPDPCYCHIVSDWFKRACMPQLSETELGFDFPNPVASVRHGPLTRALTEQECPDVLPCAPAITRRKDSQIFTHAVAI